MTSGDNQILVFRDTSTYILFRISIIAARNPYHSQYAYECFNLEVEPIMVSNFHTPDYISEKLAFDTRFNPDSKKKTGFYHAGWMVSAFYSMSWEDGYGERILDQRAVWTEWGLHTNDELLMKRLHFMKRVEESLNKAVLAVADALSYIIDKVGEYQCRGGDPVEKTQYTIIKYMMLYSLMSLAYWAGLMASMYALQAPLLSKIKIF
ncbi:MAG: hypothetical protein EU535_06155 [Promethearchaeota archaeon]|nr:MAG: hypothetical protein EU535_06155 [Candidatus Lokiarchaeota archaeon]